MTIPKIIHQTWPIATIPAPYTAYVQTWKTNHPSWQYNLYTDADNLAFVTKNFPQFLELYNGFKHNIQRADFMRYLYLKFYGGVYVDVDMYSYKPMDSLLTSDLVFVNTVDGTNNVTNCWMASTTVNPFWDILLKNIVKARSETGNVIYDVFNTTGPKILSETLLNYKPKPTFLPKITYLPFDWRSRNNFKIADYSATSYGFHAYDSSWQNK